MEQRLYKLLAIRTSENMHSKCRCSGRDARDVAGLLVLVLEPVELAVEAAAGQ